MFDWRRAQEWTDALTGWCDAQPDLVPFKGRCQVYRSELLRLHGHWDDALDSARDAQRRLVGPPAHPATGDAFYQQGELRRLQGSFSDADEAFRKAEDWGRRAEPGRALLRLAQGRSDVAMTAVRHALDEARDDGSRAGLLAAAVEIGLEAGHRQEAREAADRLSLIAEAFACLPLRATAARAQGAVLLAEHARDAAESHLRAALADWQALDVPYEVARTRELLAASALARGDAESAEAHAEEARRGYSELGAATDLRRLSAGAEGSTGSPGGLTHRELEVLKLLATGMTNRAIAANLTISEKTAANHVGNILGKLGLSSRAAATAYAYEHRLL
jgi:DNA-binding NarL/FixJ family response regulator